VSIPFLTFIPVPLQLFLDRPASAISTRHAECMALPSRSLSLLSIVYIGALTPLALLIQCTPVQTRDSTLST